MDQDELILLYDGECPICQQYATYLCLKRKYAVQVLDARQEPKRVRALREKGYDINKGMILLYGGHIYHKHEVLIMLDVLTYSRGRWERLLKKMTRRPWLMKIVYPGLFCMRWCMLKMTKKQTKI